jgi:hypothetical protein
MQQDADSTMKQAVIQQGAQQEMPQVLQQQQPNNAMQGGPVM